METTVKIIWDEPQDENWLCPENIQYALSQVCTNTKFQVAKVSQIEPLAMQKIAGKWVSIKNRLPEEYVSSYLYCQYGNGNTARAIGSYYDGEWEIEWSDDHPDAEDIKYWFEEEGP